MKTKLLIICLLLFTSQVYANLYLPERSSGSGLGVLIIFLIIFAYGFITEGSDVRKQILDFIINIGSILAPFVILILIVDKIKDNYGIGTGLLFFVIVWFGGIYLWSQNPNKYGESSPEEVEKKDKAKDEESEFGEEISRRINKSGTTTINYDNGMRYTGYLNKKNDWHGGGTYTCDGAKYVGEFKNGKYHGIGTLTSADGAIYVGEWKNDKRHGYGTHIWSDGDEYSGEWENDEMLD